MDTADMSVVVGCLLCSFIVDKERCLTLFWYVKMSESVLHNDDETVIYGQFNDKL